MTNAIATKNKFCRQIESQRGNKVAVYILEIKRTVAKKRLAKLGANFCCFRKIVHAESIDNARTIAAEDAKTMSQFDNPEAWLSNIFSSCKRVTSSMESGVLCSDYV